MKKLFPLLFAILLLATSCDNASQTTALEAPRPEGQKDVLGLAVDPIPVVRVGFIGIGMRGIHAVKRFTHIDGVEIKAICDMEQNYLDRAQYFLQEANLPKADEYIGSKDAWKELCERDDIDLVYIVTDWETHTPMSVYAMEHGKHVAVEVPAAMTIDECWQLVNTAEKTQRHMMMLENVCYGEFELATLNMAQQGVFGEVHHTEGAYIHDSREENFNERYSETKTYKLGDDKEYPVMHGYYDDWRTKYNAIHDGNPYPTHGLGSLAQILNIHRGDKMNVLVSLSSNQFGITEYAEKRFGKESPQAKREYKLGDMNTSIIKTEKGKTIMIQHDVTSPRPYSRIHLVSGTKAFAQKYPSQQMSFDSMKNRPLTKEQVDSVLLKYEFPFVTEIKEKAKAVGGHGGMDYIMDSRLIYCLQNGLPLDQDVYDAAEWSCLVELTEQSALNGGKPVQIPDFTRGAWNKIEGYKFAYKK